MAKAARQVLSVTLFGVSGPGTVVNTTFATGTSVTVGRTEKAGIVVGADSFLSGLHFEVSCGPNGVVLRDLGSSNGVFVKGQRVQEFLLTDGDRFGAGGSEYCVRLATSQPVRAAEILFALGEPLYAVLDAARDPAVLALLRAGTARYVSLYQGPSAVELESVAPYLVSLPPQCELLPQLVAEGWSKSWGIFLTAGLPMEEVWQQLRRSLMVTVNGAQHYFRFYDPRVLRVFLAVADQQQWMQFSGSIRSFLMESEDAKSLLRFYSSGYKVESDQVPAGAVEPEAPLDARAAARSDPGAATAGGPAATRFPG